MNTFLHTCGALALLSACSCTSSGEASGRKQPIQYNHKLHVQENGIECGDCHLHALAQAHATIPNIDVCGECHSDEPTTDSPDEKKLIEFVARGEQIPWVRVHRVPSHVYFSHRRHTTIAQIDCTTCHGNVEEMTEPFSRQVVPISMGRCMKCHEENEVNNDCIRCHR